MMHSINGRMRMPNGVEMPWLRYLDGSVPADQVEAEAIRLVHAQRDGGRIGMKLTDVWVTSIRLGHPEPPCPYCRRCHD